MIFIVRRTYFELINMADIVQNIIELEKIMISKNDEVFSEKVVGGILQRFHLD